MSNEPVRVSVDGAEVKQASNLIDPASVKLRCHSGHEWVENLERLQIGSCQHGEELDKDGNKVPRQIDLSCVACGSTYSVVGKVGIRSCPQCGSRMACPVCVAERVTDRERQPRCPYCGDVPVEAREPEIQIRGDVKKFIPRREA